MSVKLLNEHHLEITSLKGGCTGSSESTLVKMPHCWKSHVTAQLWTTFFNLSPMFEYGFCPMNNITKMAAKMAIAVTAGHYAGPFVGV